MPPHKSTAKERRKSLPPPWKCVKTAILFLLRRQVCAFSWAVRMTAAFAAFVSQNARMIANVHQLFNVLAVKRTATSGEYRRRRKRLSDFAVETLQIKKNQLMIYKS